MSIYTAIGRRKINLAGLDGVTDAGPASGVYVPTAGNLVVVLADDPLTLETTFEGVPAGTWMPIAIKKFVSGPANCVGIVT